jgi:hypothetical protein
MYPHVKQFEERRQELERRYGAPPPLLPRLARLLGRRRA